MNIDIRQAVKNNLNNSSFEDVKSTIVDAMNIKEEKVLPGLGALFEVWKSVRKKKEQNCADDYRKNKLIKG